MVVHHTVYFGKLSVLTAGRHVSVDVYGYLSALLCICRAYMKPTGS